MNLNQSIHYGGSLAEDEPKKQMFLGLDLGLALSHTALAIIDRTEDPNDEHKYDCVHLQRWPIKTSYQSIVTDLAHLIGLLPSKGAIPTLIVDVTAVGLPVLQLFKRESFRAGLTPIQIVGGSTIATEDGITRVPKRDLVSTVQVALQNRKLHVASSLELAPVLLSELQNFKTKISEVENDTYGTWRDGQHDDLVFAAALALWTASQPVNRVTDMERAIFAAMAL